MQYPARFAPDEDGGFVVTFRDIAEAITQGEDLEDAMMMAKDALVTAMDFYFDDKRTVPPPSPAQEDEALVTLPSSVAVKVLLLNEMIGQKVSASDLARRMETSPQEINRLIDLRHATKIDTVERAFNALGKRLAMRLT
ncbi:type II toxin-antitoxin system HicB family antitoxin [Massilia glaciei]|uniref:Type II toxin-antitoxin system HicB family antitoxin n=1 Tax=Massilia glaciei TaxID=1524097 RepID=A0A2U2I4I7_9BURK|nr:type II toxin-antitoxin system HicB family antitoxin [Massilia glaciei]PWF54647.1 type II toxin-antitoxin system HicB family antitoxin [Massilia glaciei]